MVHRSELSGLTKKKHIPLKMSEKAENVQRKTLKDLQKAVDQDTLKVWLLGRKQKEMRLDSSDSSVNTSRVIWVFTFDQNHSLILA